MINLPPIGSLVTLHHGISGEWEIVGHDKSLLRDPLFFPQVVIKRHGDDMPSSSIPASYIKDIISGEKIEPGSKKPFPKIA